LALAGNAAESRHESGSDSDWLRPRQQIVTVLVTASPFHGVWGDAGTERFREAVSQTRL